MSFLALTIALGKALAGILAAKAVETATAPLFDKAKDKLEQKLKLGKYGAIERALLGAREDVLDQCQTFEQRQQVSEVLDKLIESKPGPLLDEFSKHATQIYLLRSPDSPQVQSLVVVYRRVSGLPAVLKDEVPDEAMLTSLIDAFFTAFRERLLREEDFSHLRDYYQFNEARKQTTLQQTMLNRLDAIAANTAHPVENYTGTAQEYRDYLIRELAAHTIRGFSPQVGGGNVINLSSKLNDSWQTSQILIA